MDRYEAQKLRLQDWVKNHHGLDAVTSDMAEMLKEHPEASSLGVCHESFSDREHDTAEIAISRWGSAH